MTPSGAADVLGAGVVSPAGSDLDTFWDTISQGANTCAEVLELENLGHLPYLGCRAAGFEPESRLERHEIRRLDRAHQMAFWAADDALAGIDDHPPPERCGIVVGTGFGAAGFQFDQQKSVATRGYRAISPLTIPVVMPNSVAAHLSIRYGWTGPSLTVTTACASGADAIGEALWLLRTHRCDRVLAGGVDALLVENVAGAFARMEAMSGRFDEPERASRPFDATRDGFVLGEGAGFVVLERAGDHGSDLGTILGHSSNSDAHHIVAPAEGGEGAVRCITAALDDAGVEPGSVGHVNAHGTATARNDAAEAAAIAEVFGPGRIPVTSNKSVVGHLIGGAGAVEAIAAMRACREGAIPATANVEQVDDEIADAIDVVVETRSTESPIAISNSFGFGGHNAVLVVS